MDLYFYNIILITLSLAMLMIISYSYCICNTKQSLDEVVKVIYYFIVVKISLYYLLPAILRSLSGYQFEIVDRVNLDDLVAIYFIELISWLVWIVTFSIILNFLKKHYGLISGDFRKTNLSISKHISYIISLGFLLTQSLNMLFPESNFDFGVFKSVVSFGGLLVGPFLLVYGSKHYGGFSFVLGFFTTLIGIASIPTRGAIIYTTLYIGYLIFFVTKDRNAKKLFLGFCLAISVMWATFGGLPKFNFNGDYSEYKVELVMDVEKNEGRSTLQELEWRFGAATRIGTSFLNLYDRGEPAGLNPIINSALGILPRSLNEDKPHPSTLDGSDIFTQGMYIIFREVYGYDTYSMVEFPTGAHFYWEFGFTGVIIFSIISALYIAFGAVFLRIFGPASLFLIVVLFKPWGFVDPKIWISDIVLQIYQIIIPLIFFHYAYRSIIGLYKKRVCILKS